jgi:hypothetical protein
MRSQPNKGGYDSQTTLCLQADEFSSSGLLFSACTLPSMAQTPAPPATRQDNVKDVIHGVEITDPYRWLEDQDGKETREWVSAENAYTHALLDKLPQRAGISRRLMEMLKHDAISAPFEENGYYFSPKKVLTRICQAFIGAKDRLAGTSC